MGVAAHIVTAVTTAVMALVPASCSKLTSKAGHDVKTSATMAAAANTSAAGSAAPTQGDGKTRDLGELSMTNNYELLVTVNKNTTCLIVPKILDRKNLQLTLSLQTKNAAGAVQGMNMTQVTGAQGKSFEVTIGDVDLTLLPVVVMDN